MYLQEVAAGEPPYSQADIQGIEIALISKPAAHAAYTSLEDTMAYSVIVDSDKCNGDGECVDICPVSVYELQDGKSVPVNAEECLGCESCVEVCPTSAIVIEEM